VENLKQTDWQQIYDSISGKGYAILPGLLTKAECKVFSSSYSNEELYRSIINMQRYRFGKGEYKYFTYPLPTLLQQLRETLYSSLVPLANQWMAQLSSSVRYPEQHQDFIKQCHQQKQKRPTPLILYYTAGGFNTLHQDLYGEIYFPFQVVCALSQQEVDYTGGELVLIEQIPRAQSKAEVIRFNQGDIAIITTNFRPVEGSRGYYKARMKHGVSEVKQGERYALGIIFHDAQ